MAPPANSEKKRRGRGGHCGEGRRRRTGTGLLQMREASVLTNVQVPPPLLASCILRQTSPHERAPGAPRRCRGCQAP
eukprot:1527812-Pyramimonas_sp.AAC.1